MKLTYLSLWLVTATLLQAADKPITKPDDKPDKAAECPSGSIKQEARKELITIASGTKESSVRVTNLEKTDITKSQLVYLINGHKPHEGNIIKARHSAVLTGKLIQVRSHDFPGDFKVSFCHKTEPK